jgi:1-acyl-sn-glycerol-3-phosphate acyltransferase
LKRQGSVSLASPSRDKMSMGQKIARFLLNLFITLATRLEVYGLEQLQGLKGAILAGNHIGRLDAILIYHFTRRSDIIIIVAEKYRNNPIARWFVRRLNAIFIDRYNADFTVLREVLRRLKAGGVLVLSPEGTRSPNARLQNAWPGAGYLAAKAGVPIIPVGLTGSQDSRFFSNLRRLHRTHIVARLGNSFTLPPIPNQNRDAALQRYTDEIMCRIASLLPPDYRGAYADHPRLQELLSGS